MQNTLLPLAQSEAGGANAFVQKVLPILDFLGPAAPWILAIIIFLIGWMIAKFVRGIIEKLLGKTTIDEKISKIFGADEANSEKAVSGFIYYLLLLFILFLALDVVGLKAVVEPLQNMFNAFIGFIPKLIAAAAIIFVAVVLATIVKSILKGLLGAARVDDRLGTGEKQPITNAVGTAAYFFIILLMLPSALDALEMDSVASPIKGLISDITGYIPGLIGGIIIFAIGYLIATIVKKVLTNVLAAIGADALPTKLGNKDNTLIGGKTLSELAGIVAMTSILVVIGAQAIQTMELGFISDLTENIVPGYFNILIAVIIFAVAFFVANFLSNLVPSPFWAKVVRIGVIVFLGAVALQKANISSLTNDTFQILITCAIVAGAFAIGVGGAIALGLGGREKAKIYLEKLD